MVRKQSESIRQCVVRISAANASQTIRVERLRGGGAYRDAMSVIELEGELQEPLKGKTGISVMVFKTENPGNLVPGRPSVGAITSMRTTIQAGLSVTEAEFNRLWALVATKSIRECTLATNEPRYGSALILGASFGTAPSVDSQGSA